MKYKIIPDDIVKNLIEFLDEIQFEAASSNKQEDLHRINFINWMISELMNGLDGFDLPEENDKDADIDIDIQGRWDTIDNYKKEFGMEFPEDMSEEEWKKLIKQFDKFVEGWDKAYKKSNYKDKARQNELKKFLQELKIDHELTNTEKFELYYDEYRRRKKESETKSLKQVLRNAGIKKPPNRNNKK
jgi:coenzyme F420-reducing hydrogenase delta subunit